MEMNEHMFFLAQEIFIRGFAASEMKGEVPELSCVAIKAAHEFCQVWDNTQEILQSETRKAVETSTAKAIATPAPVGELELQKAPVKQKRSKAKK